MKIGFVGAGRIGLPMIERLAEAGHHVSVLCRSDAADARVAACGATPSRSIEAVTADASGVVLCLLHDGQVRDLIADGEFVESMARGSVLVNHTTGSPETMRLIAERAAGRDIGVVDAPVSGGPGDVDAGSITLFVGGDPGAQATARRFLSSYGDPIIDTGALGNGQKTKLVNNSLFAATIAIAVDAARLGADLGLDASALLEALPAGSSASRGLSLLASTGSAAGLFAATGEFLGKDIATVRTVATELDVDLGLVGSVLDSESLEPLRAQHEQAI